MNADIHGALVGGAIAGVTVVLGIALEAWVGRSRDRRADVEAATSTLEHLIPRLLNPISENWQRPTPDTDAYSSWGRQHEEVRRLLTTVIRRARWPMRDAEGIREEARRLYARFEALTWEWHARGRRVAQEEVKEFTDSPLTTLVFGTEESSLQQLTAAETAKIRDP